MKKINLVLFALCAFAILSCTRDREQDFAKTKEPDKPRALTVLGKKKENPYTIQAVTKALQNLSARQAGARGDGIVSTLNVQPTHGYYRFKPADVSQLMDLEEGGFDLWDFPLDTDVEDLGDYYHDPSVPADQITWMYTCIPVGVSFPTYIQHEKLADLFLFSEDSGDENDPDYWDPTECGECPDPTQPCEIKECPPGTKKSTAHRGNNQLRRIGVSAEELYDEIMLITSNEDEMINPPASARQAGASGQAARRFNPSGRITVAETDNQNTPVVPVRGLLVKSRRWFKLDHTYTNANGDFSIGKGYRRAVVLIAKFKNNNATLRAVSPDFATFIRPWETVFPIKKNLGKYALSDMEGMTYHFPYNLSRTSNEAMCFAAATTLNAVAEMRDFSVQLGLPLQPGQLNIWLSNRFAGGATALMARQIHGSFMPGNSDAATVVNNDILNFIGNAAHKGIVAQIMSRNSPDISLKYGMHIDGEQTSFTAELSNDVFHELSHAIHMSQVGGLYWKDRVHNAYAANYIAHGDPYGVKGNTREGIVAVVESWGYFMGNTLNGMKYQGANQDRVTLELIRLENQRPQATPNNFTEWIPYGMLHDMMDNGEPIFTNVNDQVSGYTIQQMFNAFRTNVITVPGLRDEILSRNGNQQAAQVNTLVSSYFW